MEVSVRKEGNMQAEDIFVQKRLKELANQSYRNNQYTFSDFLTPGELDLFFQIKNEIGQIPYTIFGGVEGCERQMIRFGSEEELGYEEPFPICCIEIAPAMLKFADALSHRDFLGALMHLGIERSTLGDIQVKEKTAYLFCLDTMADYIIENLDKVKHTVVRCRVLPEAPDFLAPELKVEKLITSSLRVDGIISKLYHLSRSQSLLLFREKKVFVNGRCMENNSGTLKEGDIVSVRGEGKFVYQGLEHETKKGNLSICVARYV